MIGFSGASNGIADLHERLEAAGAWNVIRHMTELPAMVDRLLSQG